MKTLRALSDLEQYGINLLTGEADRLCMRILCDLNEDGQDLLRDFFGLPYDTMFGERWNSQVNGKKAYGSVMLTPATLWEIARFALLSVDNFDVVIEMPGYGVRGGNHSDKYTRHYVQMAEESKDARIYRNQGKTSTAPGSGTRNQHVMSGRAV